MNLNEAHKTLGISEGTSEAERHAAYYSRRTKLEEKLGKAPIPGLKAKYRDSIQRLEEAVEIVELNADGGDLPSLTPQWENETPSSFAESEPNRQSAIPRENKSHGYRNEVAVVSIVSGVILIAIIGGWWRIRSDRMDALATNDFMESQFDRSGDEQSKKARLDAADARVELELALFSLDDEVRLGVRRLSDLKNEERALPRSGESLNREIMKIKLETYSEYQSWLEEFSSAHLARRAFKSANRQFEQENYKAAHANFLTGIDLLIKSSPERESRWKEKTANEAKQIATTRNTYRLENIKREELRDRQMVLEDQIDALQREDERFRAVIRAEGGEGSDYNQYVLSGNEKRLRLLERELNSLKK